MSDHVTYCSIAAVLGFTYGYVGAWLVDLLESPAKVPALVFVYEWERM